jgi:glycosyltransferase involved in cell wall biosynthesis
MTVAVSTITPPVRFAVICPAFRCEQLVSRSLRSIQAQTYGQYRCVLIDDVSDDNTYRQACETVAGDARFTVLRNETRQYPLANLVKATALAALDANDVIVVVDADDWLKHDRVFERLAAIYADPNVWLTYGSCELLRRPWRARLRGRIVRGSAAPYPKIVQERNLYRYHPGSFLATHLRSYKKFLWDGIRDEDLRDDDGHYFKAAGDAAIMWPLMEMATNQHIRYIEDVLYVYNNDHGLSENAQAQSWYCTEQYRVNVCVRARKPYAPLAR